MVEDLSSRSWIYLQSEVMDKLASDERLGYFAHQEMALLKYRDLLACDRIDPQQSQDGLRRLYRRWLDTPMLRGILCLMVDPDLGMNANGAFYMAFPGWQHQDCKTKYPVHPP